MDLHSSAPDALAEAMRQAGFTVLWRVPGHFNHLHVEVAGQDAARTLALPMRRPAPPRRRAAAVSGRRLAPSFGRAAGLRSRGPRQG